MFLFGNFLWFFGYFDYCTNLRKNEYVLFGNDCESETHPKPKVLNLFFRKVDSISGLIEAWQL